jgi:hypothetical protein
MRVETTVQFVCSTEKCGHSGYGRVAMTGGGLGACRVYLLELPGGWIDARPWGTFWRAFATHEAIPHPTDPGRVRQPIGDEPRPICGACRISWLDGLKDAERPPVVS